MFTLAIPLPTFSPEDERSMFDAAKQRAVQFLQPGEYVAERDLITFYENVSRDEARQEVGSETHLIIPSPDHQTSTAYLIAYGD